MKYWIYSHIDADGYTSSFLLFFAIINKLIPVEDYEDIIVQHMNYGWNFNDMNKIENGDIVYMTDFSLKLPEMLGIEKKVGKKNFHWIDHHDLVLKEYKDSFAKSKYRKSGTAATELVYNYIQDNIIEPDSTISEDERLSKSITQFQNLKRFVDLVANYDIHNKTETWYSEILPFSFALRAVEMDLTEDEGKKFWKEVLKNAKDKDTFEDFIQDMLYDGERIAAYCFQENHSLVKSYGFPINLDGFKIFAVNKGIGGSVVFEGMELSDYDGVMCFVYNGKSNYYSCSVYTDKADVDLTSIFKKYGGGGHKNAGNFRSASLKIVNGIFIPEKL